MEFRHACSFCGWERFGATPVMLAPACERCGCALDAHLAADLEREPVAAFSLPRAWMRLARAVTVVFAVLALYAATKVGYGAAGFSGALVAFGMGGFLLVPFVPQRLGAPRG
jgi:hypothetical protein